jgi:hypothetical protein
MPTPAHHVPLERRRLERLAHFLRKAAIIEARYTGPDPTWAGRPGSVADHDRRWTEPGVDPAVSSRGVESLYASARLSLVAVADQALSLARLVSEPEPGPFGSYGVEAVARSAVEIAARAWWLLEFGAPTRDRVGRMMADQLFSAYEAERMADRMVWTQGVAGMSPTSAEIRSKCDELGLSYDKEQRAPTVAGQTRPGSTPLVERLMRGTIYEPSHPMVYLLTSATTHGTHYALMRAYRDTGERRGGEPVYERFVDHRQIEPVAGVVIEAFIAVVRRAIQLTGWGWIPVDGYRGAVRTFLYDMPY